MLTNIVKGQVAVQTAAGPLTFALTFAAQKACEVRFGRRFLDMAEDLDSVMQADIGFIFWAGLRHFQPDLTEADTDAIVDEIGVLAMYQVIGEGIRAAFDAGPAAQPGAVPARPRKARTASSR